MHSDVPYTTPDEDPFGAHPSIRNRPFSHLDRWIQEQHKHPANGSHDHRDEKYSCSEHGAIKLPATPSNQCSSRRASKLIHSPSSFRNFNLSFRSSSPTTTAPSDGGSPRQSRFSFLPRSPRSSSDAPSAKSYHHRSSSVSTLNGNRPSLHLRPAKSTLLQTAPTYLSPLLSSDVALTRSRPSMSSADTYMSVTPTTIESDLLQTPSNLTLSDPLHSPGSIVKSASCFPTSSSVWSSKRAAISHSSGPFLSVGGPSSSSSSGLSRNFFGSRLTLAQKSTIQPSDMHDKKDDSRDESSGSGSGQSPPPPHVPPTRPQVAYSAVGSTCHRVKFTTLASRQRKKKKLVVSGVAFDDVKKFEGVKNWCESFGEVSQIVRMPNGDLHVYFRLAEVADTVCRLRAKVFIAGVGSVQLSWFTGDKR